jgi:hypothetical protein
MQLLPGVVNIMPAWVNARQAELNELIEYATQ